MKSIIRLLPVAAILFICMMSCDEEDEKHSGPKIVTLSADKGTFMVASLSGRVSGLDAVALDFKCGIEYSTDETFSDASSVRQIVDKKYSEDIFSITVSGIQPGKKYYFRAYYINQLQVYYGEVKTFTFEWTAPTVTTLSAELFRSYVVILKGLIKEKGTLVKDLSDYYPSGCYYGIDYSTTKSFDKSSTTCLYPNRSTDNIEVDSVICTMTTFKYGLTYYYRTFFRLGELESYGEVKSFEWTAPNVTTLSAELNESYDVILKGLIKDKGSLVKDLSYFPIGNFYGIEYSTTRAFEQNKTTCLFLDISTDNLENDSVICKMTKFKYGSTYYYRTFFRLGELESLGDVKSYRPTPGDVNGYDFVDLGLSVVWATCNVGAQTPEDYGDFFAWGETEPYYEAGYSQESPQSHWKDGKSSGYTWSTYKYCNGSYDALTKYCYDGSYGNNGFTDTKTTLDLEDDVAHVKWGGSWRMPTLSELSELSNINNCTWTWTTQNGVNGYLVTSKKSGFEGASIFLPAAGHRIDTVLSRVGSFGYYWSSSLRPDSPYYAWGLSFGSDGRSAGYIHRNDGQSVRPVCP